LNKMKLKNYSRLNLQKSYIQIQWDRTHRKVALKIITCLRFLKDILMPSVLQLLFYKIKNLKSFMNFWIRMKLWIGSKITASKIHRWVLWKLVWMSRLSNYQRLSLKLLRYSGSSVCCQEVATRMTWMYFGDMGG
jgi:hypothetical protein